MAMTNFPRSAMPAKSGGLAGVFASVTSWAKLNVAKKATKTIVPRDRNRFSMSNTRDISVLFRNSIPNLCRRVYYEDRQISMVSSNLESYSYHLGCLVCSDFL
jgi:hypothetical protein